MIQEQLTLTVSNNELVLEASRVLVDDKGKYLYYRWNEQEYLKVFKQSTADKKLDLTNVKTIYFAPKCSIPRDKAKPFLEEKKIKTVRDRDTADVIIASVDSVEAGLDTKHLYHVKTSDIIPFVKGFRTGADIDNLIVQLSTYTGKNVIINRSVVEPFYINNHIKPTKNLYGNSLNGKSFQSGDYYGEYITTVTDDFLLFGANLSNVYSQEVFNNLIGDTVIDRDAFESLRTMLNSGDKDNHLVAMTIMAGCNYEKSFVYLALLLEEFGRNAIYNHKYRNTVAFKSLTNWIGYNKYRWDKDAILDVSIEKELLTQELLDTVKASVLGGSRTYSDNFEVVDIRLTAEMQIKVDKLLNKQDDRFPSGGELLQEEVSL
jgi:hypothetical protein